MTKNLKKTRAQTHATLLNNIKNLGLIIPRGSDVDLLLAVTARTKLETDKILGSKELTNEQKQEQLENLIDPLVNKVKQIQFSSLPKGLNKISLKINEFIETEYLNPTTDKKKSTLEKDFNKQLLVYFTKLKANKIDFGQAFLIALHESIAKNFFDDFKEAVEEAEIPKGEGQNVDSLFLELKEVITSSTHEIDLDTTNDADSIKYKRLDIVRKIAEDLNLNFLFLTYFEDLKKEHEEYQNEEKKSISYLEFRELKFSFDPKYESYFFAFITNIIEMTDLFENVCDIERDGDKFKTVTKFKVKKETIINSINLETYLPNTPMICLPKE